MKNYIIEARLAALDAALGGRNEIAATLLGKLKNPDSHEGVPYSGMIDFNRDFENQEFAVIVKQLKRWFEPDLRTPLEPISEEAAWLFESAAMRYFDYLIEKVKAEVKVETLNAEFREKLWAEIAARQGAPNRDVWAEFSQLMDERDGELIEIVADAVNHCVAEHAGDEGIVLTAPHFP